MAQSSEGQKQLTRELYDRFNAMNTYGKDPEAIDSILATFSLDLGHIPASDVIDAVRFYCSNNNTFPTTGDIKRVLNRTDAQLVYVKNDDLSTSATLRKLLAQANARIDGLLAELVPYRQREVAEMRSAQCSQEAVQARIDKTVEFMKTSGADESQVKEFLEQAKG